MAGMAILAALVPCAAAQALCDRFGDTRSQAACHANNRPGKRERHMWRMAQCSFAPEPRVRLVILADGPDLDHLHPIGTNASIEAKTCEVPEGEGVWHFTRIGPFSTTGGYSWTSVLTEHDESMHSQWSVTHDGRALLSVRDHIVGSSDADGDLIGYPPIHQHHFHYAHASDISRQAVNAHGDSQCMGGGQGVYCLLTEYPGGVAWSFVPQLMIFAEFNDVRKSGSPPLEGYAFGGIFILEPSGEKPTAMLWATPTIAPLSLPIGHRGTNLYDTTLESVSWMTGTIRALDYVVDSYFHAHNEMVDDIWLIEGSPAQLGLLTRPWIDAFSNIKSGDGTISRLKAHLSRTMLASDATLLCRYGTHVEAVASYAAPFTRKAGCAFAHAPNGSDVKWTMVGFYKAQVAGLGPGLYPMHTLLRIAYVPVSGTTNHFTDRCEPTATPWTLDRLAKDNGTMKDLMVWAGGFKCSLATLMAETDGAIIRADANLPFLFQLFWAAPFLLTLLSAFLALGYCGGRGMTGRALHAAAGVREKAALVLRTTYLGVRSKVCDQKQQQSSDVML